MLNIACFISGRLTCYETDLGFLLSMLSTDPDVNIHLFCSINGVRDSYHIEAETLLLPWLGKIVYEEYKVPSSFIHNIHRSTLFQDISGVKQPYTVLSCFYNDYKAYKLIEEYQTENNINFDICCKLRPDMRFNHITPDIFKNRKDTILYSCIPECEIYFFGLRNINICICDAFAFGSMKVMKRYCDTYNFILNTNNRLKGNYSINYENCLTESYLNEVFNEEQIDDFSIRYMSAFDRLEYKVEYFTCPYVLNKKRRSRDTVVEIMRPAIT